MSVNHNRPLAPRAKMFVSEYVVDFNRGAAAIRAGYSKKNAEVAAARLLIDPRVKKLLDEAKERTAKRNDVTVDWLVAQYKRIVTQDVRKLYKADGTMKLPHELDDDTAFTVTGIDIVPGKYGNHIKYGRADQLRALDSLARYKKMFSDDESGKDTTVKIVFVGGLPARDDEI